MQMPGKEIARYFSETAHGLVSYRDNGETYLQLVGEDWKRFAQKKVGVPLEQWRANKMAHVDRMPTWAREVVELPSMEQVEDWVTDSVCETVTGDTIEPDGHGPDGAPSWLVALGLV